MAQKLVRPTSAKIEKIIDPTRAKIFDFLIFSHFLFDSLIITFLDQQKIRLKWRINDRLVSNYLFTNLLTEYHYLF